MVGVEEVIVNVVVVAVAVCVGMYSTVDGYGSLQSCRGGRRGCWCSGSC